MKIFKDHIMVTGSNGFIGSNLIKALSKKFFVHAYHRGKKRFKNYENVSSKKIDLIKLKKIDHRIKMIVHCASNTPPGYPQTNCYKNNTKVDNKILSLIKKSNVKVFIFLSSISVYGKNKPRVISENTRPKPSDLYGKSKLETELKIKKLSKKLKINFIILRLCTIVGRDCHSTFLSRIGERIKSSKKLDVYGSNNYFNSCFHITTLSKNILNILNTRKFKNNFNLLILHSKNPIKLKKIFSFFKNHLNKNIILNELKTIHKGYLIKSNKLNKNKFILDSTANVIKKYIIDLK